MYMGLLLVFGVQYFALVCIACGNADRVNSANEQTERCFKNMLPVLIPTEICQFDKFGLFAGAAAHRAAD